MNIYLEEPISEISSEKDFYFVTCPICNKRMKSLIPKHLKFKHNMTLEEFKISYPNTPFISKYTIESKTKSMRESWKNKSNEEIKESVNKNKETKLERYGDANFNNREKAKETCKEKYGVDHCSNVLEIIEKRKSTRNIDKDIKDKISTLKNKQTTLKNHGDENFKNREKAKNTMILLYNSLSYNNIDQNKQTKLKRYGNEKYTNREKGRQTNLERYGREYGFDHEKSKQTNLERYGVEHVMQNPESHEKQQKYRWKDYILPSGKIIKVQGFEPKLLNVLLDFYHEDEIITSRKDIPAIWYFTPDGKKHRYFADFYIPSENLILEVKSIYTYKKYKDINILKKEATINKGFNYKLLIL